MNQTVECHSVKLWLDDLREAPEGWLRAQTRDEAIAILKNNYVEFASLDYDIRWDPGGDGCDWENTRTGMAIVIWMWKTGKWPRDGVAVHSSNVAGAQRMISSLGSHYRRNL